MALSLADTLARRDAEEAYGLALDTVSQWVSRRLTDRASLGAARLAPLVEVCEKVARQAREVDVQSRSPAPRPLAVRRSCRRGSADGLSRC